jgi:hypothetical protein
MASDWLVEICCRACGAACRAPVATVAGVTRLLCPNDGCGGHADLPPDLAGSAQFLLEESRRRLALRP